MQHIPVIFLKVCVPVFLVLKYGNPTSMVKILGIFIANRLSKNRKWNTGGNCVLFVAEDCIEGEHFSEVEMRSIKKWGHYS